MPAGPAQAGPPRCRGASAARRARAGMKAHVARRWRWRETGKGGCRVLVCEQGAETDRASKGQASVESQPTFDVMMR